MANSGARWMMLILGTVAAWSLLLLIAVWGGLAGRYSLHPDDPGRVEAVPAVDLQTAATKLPDMDSYAAIGRRPLFSADRLPFVGESTDAGEDIVEQEPVLMPLEATLTGVIMIGKDTAIALIKDKSGASQSVKVGEVLDGDLSIYKLVELAPRKAVFDGPRGRSELELAVFDGKGGAPVTRLRKPGQPGSADSAKPADAEPASPEDKAEQIRRRIEERRRQMREEAERARDGQNR